MKTEDPRQVLGVSGDAGDEEIRAAYLRKIKEYPPERAPREFEKVRDAYELLRDPRRRAVQMLLSLDPDAPLASILQGQNTGPRFTGPEPWLAVASEPKPAPEKGH